MSIMNKLIIERIEVIRL